MGSSSRTVIHNSRTGTRSSRTEGRSSRTEDRSLLAGRSARSPERWAGP
ncbi:hypothetical protein [Streptomyces sp. NPDC098781]